MKMILEGKPFQDELQAVAARHNVQLVVANSLAEFIRELPDADALWTDPTVYDADRAEALKRNAGPLKWIQLKSVGFDAIERFGAPEGVVVANAGDAYAPFVAEHALALLLALFRRLPDALARGARHEWDQAIGSQMRLLDEATVTIFGFGQIGRQIAARLRPFGSRIIAVDRAGRPEPLADEMLSDERLVEALKISDALIVAAPLTQSTRRTIGAMELAALPPHAVVVNIARGEIIDSNALFDALERGVIAGAGLDVTDPEPLPSDNPLWARANVIITPHVAAMGGALPSRRLAAIIERNLVHFMKGEELEHRVSAKD
ncbi:D-isomer specific 2-hydroxyacid dehydrogenase NAD-binding [Methylocella silvestris BL2]|uniref:D-isomer specific 2-hydroxyacid dehydrogenase NAD-binding n=1 Tax=Methylocella silvestris (strain DSM 15510 / CIP 108128 / LMG 27833 / NCIMB 13906 / BL2) TaxID=395965 RepID=B8EMF1_METSB|nr:D-2-hydroxyacid dehydrogenase [Methylocella silvestris]ACK52079.1 D-isomer specific 2-hydroxyacid dehydrogenase NAD-binding [Methylocella silvestris BL2]